MGSGNGSFVDKHPLKAFCLELLHEPVAFAQEEIIDVQPASVYGLKVSLSFRDDQVGVSYKLFYLLADIGKVCAGDSASVARRRRQSADSAEDPERAGGSSALFRHPA